MALSLAKIILFSFLVATATVHLAVDAGSTFYSTTSNAKLKLGSEKLTHFHFYIHDIADGPPTPTAVKVAGAPGAAGESPASFGSLYVIDDALTSGPNLTASEIVGRAQGIEGNNHSASNMIQGSNGKDNSNGKDRLIDIANI